jgi:WD40-like Beta Propeller Repeat
MTAATRRFACGLAASTLALVIAPAAFAAHPEKNTLYRGKGDLGGGAAFYSLHVNAKGKAIDSLDIRSKCEVVPFAKEPTIKIDKSGNFSFKGKVKAMPHVANGGFVQDTVKLKISGSFPSSTKVKGKFSESTGSCKDSKHKFTGNAPKKKPSGPPAQNGRIVFVCAGNLCETDANGKGRRQLTTDGGYSSPSLSADGKHLVFASKKGIETSDGNAQHRVVAFTPGSQGAFAPRMRDDGTEILWTAFAPSFQTYTSKLDGSNRHVYNTGNIQAGFAPFGLYICAGNGGADTIWTGFNVGDGDCLKKIASAPAYHDFGWRPMISFDTKMVVDTESPTADTDGVYLFDTGDGHQIRQLTTVAKDDNPTFSADSKYVLFDRGGSIYRVPVGGGAATLFISNGGQAAASY